jgi:glyoxylase-like metal-dependent hydrolase (beta-lactamase superfamily II)
MRQGCTGPADRSKWRRTWFVPNFSGVTWFETEAGLVLADSGTERLAPGLAAQLRKHTQVPVHIAIFTHGHLDHTYGLKSFLLPDESRPRIVAWRAILDRSRTMSELPV